MGCVGVGCPVGNTLTHSFPTGPLAGITMCASTCALIHISCFSRHMRTFLGTFSQVKHSLMVFNCHSLFISHQCTHTWKHSFQPGTSSDLLFVCPPHNPPPPWSLLERTLPVIPFFLPLPGVLSAPCGCKHNRASVLSSPWKLSHACLLSPFTLSSIFFCSSFYDFFSPGAFLKLSTVPLSFFCCFWSQFSLGPPNTEPVDSPALGSKDNSAGPLLLNPHSF